MLLRHISWISLVLCTQLACSSFRPAGKYQSQAERVPQGSEVFGNNKQLAFDWPVDDARLTQRFLPHKKRRPHWGIDLASNRGSKILASHYGTVVYVGSSFKGYGKLVIVEAGPKWATFYSHLDKILVREGELVKPGDVIGHMGRTGRATGVHLHFEVRTNRMPVDPLNYLPGGERI